MTKQDFAACYGQIYCGHQELCYDQYRRECPFTIPKSPISILIHLQLKKKKSVSEILRKNPQEPHHERVNAFCKSVLLQHIPIPNERHSRLFCMPVNYWSVTDVELEGKLL